MFPAVPVSTRIDEEGSLPMRRCLVNDRALKRVSCHHLVVMVCFVVSWAVAVGSTVATSNVSRNKKYQNNKEMLGNKSAFCF